MATFDAHANFAATTVAVAPSPAGSGLTLDVTDAGPFPAVPFNCTASPPNVRPTLANSEIVRVTNITGSTFTIDRAQEGTSAKNIAVGWVIANSITVKVITDIETAINAPVNVSAGATSYQTSAFTFDNANGVSFGITNGIITASVVPPSGAVVSFSAGTTDVAAAGLSFDNANGISFGLDGSTITAQHNGLTSQSNQAASAANGSFAFQTLSFSNTQGVSFATSAGGAIVASIATSLTNVKVSAGDTSYLLSALTFDNGNNVSFGITDSVVTASASFPAQTNQTIGLYGSSNTILTSSTTMDARSFSIRAMGSLSVGMSDGELVLSAANALTSQSNQAFSAAGGSSAFQTLSFNNSFGVSFSNSGGAVVASIATTYAGTGFTSAGNNIGISGTLNTSGLSLSATVVAQTNQTLGLYGSSNTTLTSSGTVDARSLTVRAIGSLSVGYSNGELLLSAANALTSQSNQAFSAAGGSSAFQTLSFGNSFGVSFSNSDGSVVGSIATTYAGTGFTSAGNNIGLSGTLNTSGLSLSATVAAQTNQTLGLYASSNTTLTSSGTLDARSFSVRAIGSLTAGFSNGELLLSAANALTSQSNQAFSAGGGSSAFQTLSFGNSFGVSFSNSNGSVVGSIATTYAGTGFTSAGANIGLSGTLNTSGLSLSATVAAQTNQTVEWYASSNTTLTSRGTADARSLSVRGIGGASIGFSNGELLISGATGLTSQSTQFLALTLGGNTAGTTTFHATNNASLFLNGGNNITLSGNGSTVTISAAAQSNQTLGLYMSSNTTSSVSSGTVDARSMTFRGMGVASVGYSGGEVIVSVPAGGGGLTNINISAGTTSNNLSAFTFANSNGVSFGLDGSTVTATVSTYSTVGTATTVYPVASANSVGTITRWAAEDHRHAGIGAFGISSEGNTAGTTGSQQGTYWLQGGNNITISQITSNNGSHTAILSGPNIATVSMWPDVLPASTALSTYYSGSTSQGAGGNSTQTGYTFSLYAVPLVLPVALAFSELRIGIQNGTSAGTGSITHMYSVGIYTNNANTLSRVTGYYGGLVLSQNSQTAQTFSVFTATTGHQSSGAGGGMMGISKHSVYSSQGNISANSQLFGRVQFVRVDSGAVSTLTAGQYWVVYANATASSGANVMQLSGVLQSNAISSVNVPDLGRENSTQTSNYLPAWGAISTTFTSVSNAATFFPLPSAIDMANMSRSSSAWQRFHFPYMRNLS